MIIERCFWNVQHCERRGESISKRGEGHIPSQARPEAASAAPVLSARAFITTPTPVPLTQHEELYTGREERCVQVHRDRKQSDDGGGEAGRDPHQTRTAERKDPPIWSEACCFIFQQNSFSTDIFRDFYCQALTVICCMVFMSAPHLKVLEDAFK